ncbi:hypothetical protein HGRIS_000738 [Hohenbuehelia grisea]|uniref:CENP-V/GFA domain-containing protein n=1 Tax=Hohenbuehelia grisea TaxID=104357 RepID=A0ABR3IPK7_9AGAR
MSTAVASIVRRGACLCQRVRYELRGEPKSHLVCHCKNCQKFSGSAFMTNLFYKPEDVIITQGKESIKTYKDANTDSGNTLTRSFCSECGSSLFLKNSTIELTIVCSGNVEDPVQLIPKRELYPQDKRSWVSLQTLNIPAKKSNM